MNANEKAQSTTTKFRLSYVPLNDRGHADAPELVRVVEASTMAKAEGKLRVELYAEGAITAVDRLTVISCIPID